MNIKIINKAMAGTAFFGLLSLGFGLLLDSEMIKNITLFIGIFIFAYDYFILVDYIDNTLIMVVKKEQENEKKED